MSNLLKLVFVYNIKSGKLNSAIGSLHKIVSPKTYQCSLCAITHGAIGKKNEWKAFLSQLNSEAVFLHSNEFEEHYPSLNGTELPAVFIEMKGKPIKQVLGAQDLHGMTLSDLIKHLNAVLHQSNI